MKALTDKILLWLGRTYERIAPIVAQAASAVKKTAKYSWIRACQVWVATLANSDAPVYKPPVYHPLPGREPTFRERAIFNFVIGGSCLAYLIAVIVVIRG